MERNNTIEQNNVRDENENDCQMDVSFSSDDQSDRLESTYQSAPEIQESQSDIEMSYAFQNNDLVQLEENPAPVQSEQALAFGKGLMLGVAYAANLGGTSTLIGTATNLIFSAVYSSFFPHRDPFTFPEWMLFAFPVALLFLIVVWFYLIFKFVRKYNLEFNLEEFELDLKQLGPFSLPEKLISGLMLSMMFFLFTRNGFGSYIPGWKTLFPRSTAPADGTVAMFFGLLLFVWDLINWSPDCLQINWEALLLLGGGLALSNGVVHSGLSSLLGAQLLVFQHLSLTLQIFLLCLFVTFTTEIASNTAIANIILPILASLSIQLHLNPLYLMIPAAISCSYAFMLPIATPPNTIVFSYRLIRMSEMVSTGFLLNIFGSFFLTFCTRIYGPFIFGPVTEII